MKRMYYVYSCGDSSLGHYSAAGKARLLKAKEETIPVRVMKVRMEDVSKVLEYAAKHKGAG